MISHGGGRAAKAHAAATSSKTASIVQSPINGGQAAASETQDNTEGHEEEDKE